MYFLHASARSYFLSQYGTLDFSLLEPGMHAVCCSAEPSTLVRAHRRQRLHVPPENENRLSVTDLIRWDRYQEVFVIAKGQSAAKFCVATHCVFKIFYIVTFSGYPSLNSWERYLWWVNYFFPCLSLEVIVLWLFGLVLKSLTFGVYLANHGDFLVGNSSSPSIPIPSPRHSHAPTSSQFAIFALLTTGTNFFAYCLLLTPPYISLSRYIVYHSLSFSFFFFPSSWSYAWQPIALLHPGFLPSLLQSGVPPFVSTNTQSTATQSHSHGHDEHPSPCSLHACQSPTHPSSWRTVRFSSSNFAKTDFITIVLLLDGHPLASSLVTNRPR